jgi:hypothetical protein
MEVISTEPSAGPFGVGLDLPVPDSSGEIGKRGRDLLG